MFQVRLKIEVSYHLTSMGLPGSGSALDVMQTLSLVNDHPWARGKYRKPLKATENKLVNTER